MPRRLWQGVGALVLGAAFLVAAGLAGASRGFAQGGIFRVGYAGASVQIDPQLAYVSTAWWLEYATAAKLFNYPDRAGAAGGVLQPEVASGYKVSRDGRTYTFTIRQGFRFSDGAPVTAKSFAYAIDRVANHDLASPGAPFITDPNGTNIVGAIAVNAGKATHVSGVMAKGIPPGDPADEARPDAADEAGDAVLPGDLAPAAADEGSGGRLSVCGPIRLRSQHAERAHRAAPQPVLPRPPPSQPGGRRGLVESRPAGGLPRGRGRQPRRGPAAGRRGSWGRAQVRRQQEPLLGRAEQLRRLCGDQQPAAAVPEQRRPAPGAQLDDRPPCPAGAAPAVLGVAVDTPAAPVRSRLGHREEAAAVPGCAECPQGPAARGGPPAGRARERRLPQLGSWRAGAGAVRPRRPRQARRQGGADQAEGVHGGGHLRRDRQAEQRPRPRRLARLVLRRTRSRWGCFPWDSTGSAAPGRSSSPGSARSSGCTAPHGCARSAGSTST